MGITGKTLQLDAPWLASSAPSCSSCSSSTCCYSSRSGCSSSSSSDGCSCGRSIGVSSFQGFHSFVLMYFINKQTRAVCLMQGFQAMLFIFKQHLSAAVLCFPTSFKFKPDQESGFQLQPL